VAFLTDVVDGVRRRLAADPPDEAALRARVAAMPPPRDLEAALRAPGVGVIAEIKRTSPSAGRIAQADAGWRAATYQAAGAAAVSVLTEAAHFGGSLEDLRAARACTSLPVLRKDFLVHPAQVLEARAAGADAVLLIPAAVSDRELGALLAAARALGMSAVVEGHSAGDVDRALAAGARIVGVNARDLETLDVDPGRARGLLAAVPPDRVRVLESGIATWEDVRLARRAGADAVLVGEALMRAPDPAAKLRELLGP
jgi:indole-3-glycerol phosphate synthase